MGKGEVPGAQVVVAAKQRQVVLDEVASLDADEGCQLPPGDDGPHPLGHARQRHRIAMPPDGLVDRVHHVQGLFEEVTGALGSLGGPAHGEELGVDPALPYPGEVHVPVGVTRCEVPVVAEESHGGVRVCIDNQGLTMDPLGPLDEFALRIGHREYPRWTRSASHMARMFSAGTSPWMLCTVAKTKPLPGAMAVGLRPRSRPLPSSATYFPPRPYGWWTRSGLGGGVRG